MGAGGKRANRGGNCVAPGRPGCISCDRVGDRNSSFLILLADAEGLAKQRDKGLEHLAETEERWAEAELHRVRGELLRAGDDIAGAERSFSQAISIAQQQSAKFWELRAAISLARLWRKQGKRDAACDLLTPIYGWFAEGFDTPVLKEAKALLDEL